MCRPLLKSWDDNTAKEVDAWCSFAVVAESLPPILRHFLLKTGLSEQGCELSGSYTAVAEGCVEGSLNSAALTRI